MNKQMFHPYHCTPSQHFQSSWSFPSERISPQTVPFPSLLVVRGDPGGQHFQFHQHLLGNMKKMNGSYSTHYITYESTCTGLHGKYASTLLCLRHELSSCLANRLWHFSQTNHGAYSNPDTQLGAQNKDFCAVWQTDLIGRV